MATLNEHTSVLSAIFSDISDQSDTNFIYILLASECQQQIRKNDRKKNKHTSDVTNAAGIEVFYDPKK